MDNIRIKVSSQALYTGASEVRKTVSSIQNRFSAIESAVNRSSGYWQGDAADTHRTVYQEMKGTVNEMLVRLKEHASDLQSMTQEYLAAEQEASGQAADLPADVII